MENGADDLRALTRVRISNGQLRSTKFIAAGFTRKCQFLTIFLTKASRCSQLSNNHDYFRADRVLGDDLAPIQRAILPSIPDAQPLRPLGEN